LETNFSLYHKSLSFPGLFGTSGKLNLNDYNLVFGPRLHYKWSHAHALVGIDAISGVSSMAGVIGAGGIFQVNHRVGVEGGVDYYFTHYTRAQNDIRAVAGIVVTFGSLGGTTEQAIAPSKIDIPRTTTRAAGSGMKVAALGVTARVGTQEGAEILDLAPNERRP
jgi:hypothetical protein